MTASFAPKRMSPQLRQPSTTRAMMLDVMVALTPTLGMAVFFFGSRVLALCAVSIVSCLLFELLYRRLTRQSITLGDLSACVTGLLLALSLPASARDGGRIRHYCGQAVLWRTGEKLYESRPGRADAGRHAAHAYDQLDGPPSPNVSHLCGRGVRCHPHVLPP